MNLFLRDLAEMPFLQYALAAGLLASVACGVTGTYVVARRISYLAGGIAHCTLGGLGAARYLQQVHGWDWLHPLYGAVAAAVAAALVIGWVSLRGGEREDTAIGALWALGMAAGVLFIYRTPGYGADLMRYLFGNILMVSREDLWIIAALDAVVVASVALFHKQFLAVCFDEEFARLRGVRVEAYYLGLLVLTALTVVLLVTVVGIVLVIALLTLPAAMAGRFVSTLLWNMVVATVLAAVLTTGGLVLSYAPDLPAGATIIVLTGAGYLAVAGGGTLHRRWRGRLRRKSAA